MDGIQRTADNLKNMVTLNPVEMAGPVETYIRQFDNLKTDAAVISALKTFGKYSGAARALSQSAQQKRKKLSSEKDRLKCRINV